MTDFQKKIDDYAEAHDVDIIAYLGGIVRNGADFIIKQCRARTLRKNVLLILATRGGDPNAGYKFARCLQEAYKTVDKTKYNKEPKEQDKKQGNFQVFIDNLCKSAGTLICLGSDKIIMSGNGELGPIDIQHRKRDEVGESESGLTPIQAVRFLELQSGTMFKRYFLSCRFGEDLGFSTKMSTEVAAKLATGLLAPICSQIDPIRLAEVDRSMRIAREYGERLANENLKTDTLDKLLAAYPSHGFVIDRNEARNLFNSVEEPNKELREIGDLLSGLIDDYINEQDKPLVAFLSSQKKPKSTEPKNTDEE